MRGGVWFRFFLFLFLRYFWFCLFDCVLLCVLVVFFCFFLGIYVGWGWCLTGFGFQPFILVVC